MSKLCPEHFDNESSKKLFEDESSSKALSFCFFFGLKFWCRERGEMCVVVVCLLLMKLTERVVFKKNFHVHEKIIQTCER